MLQDRPFEFIHRVVRIMHGVYDVDKRLNYSVFRPEFLIASR